MSDTERAYSILIVHSSGIRDTVASRLTREDAEWFYNRHAEGMPEGQTLAIYDGR